MESLNNVFKIIKKGVWMTSVDLKDAFFTVPVHNLHQKCFMFEWIQKFYKFLGMPNGYSNAMRIFTNISKPVFGHLRQEDHLSVIFFDDSYLQGHIQHECLNNIKATVDLLLKLGFIVHKKKSVLITTQKIEFLGFIIDSNFMTIKIKGEKAAQILLKIRKFLQNPPPVIRKLASIEDLKWSLGAIPNAKSNINTPQVDFEINTDASETGWGATDGSNPTWEF